MPCPELGVPVADFVRRVEIRPDEVFDMVLGRDLKDADAPVDLSLFTDGEAVGVYEGKIDRGEG